MQLLDRRPIIVALAGANGAGKSTFYHAHLRAAGLRFVNADVLARELKIKPYIRGIDELNTARTHQAAGELRLETVFPDPVGDKLNFLEEVAANGYTVVLCFIGLSSPKVSEQRVAMRIAGRARCAKRKTCSEIPSNISKPEGSVTRVTSCLDI